jgi:hypothetical protein
MLSTLKQYYAYSHCLECGMHALHRMCNVLALTHVHTNRLLSQCMYRYHGPHCSLMPVNNGVGLRTSTRDYRQFYLFIAVVVH